MFGKNDVIQIEARLGSGGSGAVYKAWHSGLQKHVVIKELVHSEANDIKTRRNEVEALKNIKNTYVPQVLDFLTEGNRSYTVLEFVEGESFDKLLIRGQRFTEFQVIRWYCQLAAALKTIHKHNVCHRDIKPANIMRMPGGDVCLIDFNAALVAGNDMRLASRSPGYASPEQYKLFQMFEDMRNKHEYVCDGDYGEGEAGFVYTNLHDCGDTTELVCDADNHTRKLSVPPDNSEFAAPTSISIDWERSDIYSLGATMYHLLTGIRPTKRAEELVPISQLGHFNKEIVDIIERSMQIDPEKRFKSANQLLNALRNINNHHRERKNPQIKKLRRPLRLYRSPHP